MNGSADKKFVVALTADFFGPDGSPKYRDLGLSIFEGQSQIARRTLAEHRPQLGCDQLGDAHGVIVLTPAVTAETVSQSENLLAIGRFGVGYDAVDVAACTAADVVVFITAGAVDRSVAEATVGWMIAITHHMRIKDQLVRTGQWDERSRYMGGELRDRVMGVIGLGGIARATLELLSGFGMRQPLACDPLIPAAEAARLGVRLVTLDELLREADFVSIHCPLTEQTRGMIGARELALMKPEAYLINTARGNIVDEDALYQALASRQIAGAAIDCFAQEPVKSPHRLGELDNVLLAPHSIAWTNELFRDIGRAVCQGMVDLSLGRRPKGVVNPAVLDRPGFRAKWQRICGKIPQ
ncbi:MAG: NAD(P)-dependent oxidoreductase [Pirellulaceae bacterium]